MNEALATDWYKNFDKNLATWVLKLHNKGHKYMKHENTVPSFSHYA